MIKKVIIGLLGATLLLASCNENSSEKAEQKPNEKEVKQCVYSVEPTSIKLVWTSFKHTEKTPVEGTFDLIKIKNTVSSKDPKETFREALISIDTRTTNTSNSLRDEKIKNSFFGTMDSTAYLVGEIISLEGDKNGTAIITITMNGIEKEQEFLWKIEDETVTFKTQLSVDKWEATPSLDSLNGVCEDLHKGADGQSVLWPTVDINIIASLKKECN